MSSASGPISDRNLNPLDRWGTMPAGATISIFLPGPHMDVRLYKKAFSLTSDECEAIRRFTTE